jgi:hypothetical protein
MLCPSWQASDRDAEKEGIKEKKSRELLTFDDVEYCYMFLFRTTFQIPF